MKTVRALLLMSVLAGCTPQPAVFPGPPADAPTWALNPGLWGTTGSPATYNGQPITGALYGR